LRLRNSGDGTQEAGRSEAYERGTHISIVALAGKKVSPVTSILKNMPISVKPRKAIPFEFVLEALADLSPRTNPMFGCLAVYVKEKIVLILRDKQSQRLNPENDNGVWLATTAEHHESLRAEFPHIRSIKALGKNITGWQILPADAPDFEESALRAVELVAARDPRIGKVPKTKKKKRY
jgi:hypothetical protein